MKRRSGFKGNLIDESFDDGHPMAKAIEQLVPGDSPMSPEARERVMRRLFMLQRRKARGLRSRQRNRSRLRRVALVMAPAAAAGLVLLLVMLLSMPVSPPRDTRAYYATLDSKLGSVEAKPPRGEWEQLQSDTEISEGSNIRTGADSYAAIGLPDGSIARLTDTSEIQIKDLGEGLVKLEHVSGSTYHRVQKGTGYTVRNGEIDSTALGTAFNVDTRTEDSLEILTVESAVEVRIGSHKPIKVSEGEMVIVSTAQEKKAVKQPVSRERLKDERLLSNVRQDEQAGYRTGIYEQVDVAEEEQDGEPDEPEQPPSIEMAGAVSDSVVDLEWRIDDGDDYERLVLVRSEETEPSYPEDEIARFADTSIRSASDDSIMGGVTYQYRLIAVGESGPAAFSNTVVLTVPVPEPQPEPASISLVSSLSAGGVTLEWSVSGARVSSGFVIERVVDRAPEGSSTPAGKITIDRLESRDILNTYLDSNVRPGHTYVYRVGLLVDGAVMVYSNRCRVPVSTD